MKKFIAITLATLAVLSLTGCNYSLVDTTYKFNKAIISLPDGTVVKGTVTKWSDYDDGSDFIQVTVDGKVYYTHASNVVLISE